MEEEELENIDWSDRFERYFEYMHLREKDKEEKIRGKRKTQIGDAKRAEKIRTYNFPQDRITDHRIKKNWSNIQEIMEGKLDKMIETLRKELE